MESPVAEPPTQNPQDTYLAALLADPQMVEGARENTRNQIDQWKQAWIQHDIVRRSKEGELNAIPVAGRLRMIRWAVNANDRAQLQANAAGQLRRELVQIDYQQQTLEASIAEAERFLDSLPSPAEDIDGDPPRGG